MASTRIRIVEWNGDKVLEDVLRAAESAIDETTKEAARRAADNAPRNRGQLASEVINEPAERTRSSVVGKFGATSVRGFYGLFWEEYRGRPFLRPAADAVFPELASRIARRLG